MRRAMLLTTLIGAISNAGCNDGVGDYGVGGCPPLAVYSRSEQSAAAAEIRRNPDGALARMARDYGKLRKACRA